MNHARVGYTSTLLPSGEVLVAGGYSRVLGPCAWVVSATGVSWSTAVSQARRCRASLTRAHWRNRSRNASRVPPIAALDGTSLTTQGSKKPRLSRTISLCIGASGVRSSSQLRLRQTLVLSREPQGSSCKQIGGRHLKKAETTPFSFFFCTFFSLWRKQSL